jgi:hypothetical protein
MIEASRPVIHITITIAVAEIMMMFPPTPNTRRPMAIFDLIPQTSLGV